MNSLFNDQVLASHAFRKKHRHLQVPARTSLRFSCSDSHNRQVVQLTNPTCHPLPPSGPHLSQGHRTHSQTEGAESERMPVDLAQALATMQLVVVGIQRGPQHWQVEFLATLHLALFLTPHSRDLLSTRQNREGRLPPSTLPACGPLSPISCVGSTG